VAPASFQSGLVLAAWPRNGAGRVFAAGGLPTPPRPKRTGWAAVGAVGALHHNEHPAGFFGCGPDGRKPRRLTRRRFLDPIPRSGGASQHFPAAEMLAGPFLPAKGHFRKSQTFSKPPNPRTYKLYTLSGRPPIPLHQRDWGACGSRGIILKINSEANGRCPNHEPLSTGAPPIRNHFSIFSKSMKDQTNGPHH
jgi:hypothetical protein